MFSCTFPKFYMGSITNYVDTIMAFLTTYLPPFVDIFYGMNVDKKWTFLTTYLPPLVNIVCERPLCLQTKMLRDSNNP